VLLLGESGTGKELLARALHEHSPRMGRPFVVVNCAALPESILEAELFGHERGAFTGAVARKEGRIERAHGGTLFLDEVGELSPPVQAKLLRVLQEGELERVGGTETLSVDFRLVSATNRDLAAAVRDGTFREDLYYRLNVIEIRPPPLRERPEDILLLAEHFLRIHARKNGKPIGGLTDEARAALSRYRWPGNVRELENVMERAVVLTREPVIDLRALPAPLLSADRGAPEIERHGGKVVIPLGTKLEEVERVLIHETLKETGGDKSLAAQLLGIAARTIYRKLEAEREG
jgi:two-component system response regulator HydG